MNKLAHQQSYFEDGKENEVLVSTYAHLIDACTQYWFAVCSIFEDLFLKTINREYPHIHREYPHIVYLTKLVATTTICYLPL